MSNRTPTSTPEKGAPRIVAVFFTEIVSRSDKEYALLQEYSDGATKISLFDFQMETLIYGLHCLDRAVFAVWGAEHRAAFMNNAFGFACEMFSGVLPESARGKFLEDFQKHCDARQLEYGAMKPIPKDGAMRNVLPYEFSKRLCIGAGVNNPPVQLVLMEWAIGIMTMMVGIAKGL